MKGEAWTPENKARAYAMADEGLTYRQIANTLGCKRQRVKNFFAWRGVVASPNLSIEISR